MFDFPEGKRYNTAAGRYRRLYGERLQKLVIDADFTCLNRDGTVGVEGCSYCDSAAFHPGYGSPGKSALRDALPVLESIASITSSMLPK